MAAVGRADSTPLSEHAWSSTTSTLTPSSTPSHNCRPRPAPRPPRPPGNVLRAAAHLAADHGPFDLVLAGGLFDYLEERFARALIRTTLSRPGGTFSFSNIATPNPYAALMPHIAAGTLSNAPPPTVAAGSRRRTGHQPMPPA